jgi:iron-sulfur cluster assembly protein
MISLSQKAIDKIKVILTEEQKQGWNLRVGVKGGGCSGFNYMMRFDQSAHEQDHKFQFEDISVVVDSKSLVYLAGTQIDYTDGLNGSGFVFVNPNAVKSCGCGNSFAV